MRLFGWAGVVVSVLALGCGDSNDLLTLPQTNSVKPTGRVREFTLVAAPTTHDFGDGMTTPAFAFNGQIPGPLIRVTEGDTVRITVRNELNEPTSIHWHGLHLPYDQDGAAPLNQNEIKPGATHLYEFTASHAGTFMYHPHAFGTDTEQIDKGLYGVFIIDPQVPDGYPTFDKEYILMFNGWNVAGMEHAMGGDYNAWSINGKLYPNTEPLRVTKGDRVRLRLLNLSNGVHPIHIHGHDFVQIAVDGEPLRYPQRMNTMSLAPGQTAEAYFEADNPGVWMLHCHELHHAEGGMMTTIIYDGFDTGKPPQKGHNGGHG